MKDRKYLFYRENLGSYNMDALTLDAAESSWLQRDLEWVDTQVYSQPYVELEAMSHIPSKSDIPEWAQTYTWREIDGVGKAKILTSMSDDFPRSDVSKKEFTKTIKMVGDSYGYTWDEMQACASQPNCHLDADRAIYNRFTCEEERDRLLAYGSSQFGIEGLYTLTNTRTYTLADKAKGGKTWGTLAAPNATGREVAYDLMGFAQDVVDNAQGFIRSVSIILPIEAYGYAANKEMSATDNTKALTAALASPFIADIKPWYRGKAANSGGVLANDTMIAFPKNPMFLCGINTMPYRIWPAQQKGLEWVIYAGLKTGGVVCRHPFLVSKATGFGA